MKILVTFAVEREFAPWRTRREFRTIPFAASRVYETRIGAAEVRVLITGIGLGKSQAALQELVQRQPVVCISAGLAGGLRPELQVGDVLAARAVQQLRSGHAVECSRHLLDIARSIGANEVDLFLTSQRLIWSPDEKRRLGDLGAAVEMESFDVLYGAQSRGVEAVAIRAVSDTVDDNLPSGMDAWVKEDGTVSLLRAAGGILRRPRQVPQVLRMTRSSGQAAEALAVFLDRYVGSLASLETGNVTEAECPVAAT